MITCERCNTENLDGAQYCDECGALLATATRMRRPETNVLKPSAPSAPLSQSPTAAPKSNRSSTVEGQGKGAEQKFRDSGARLKDSNGSRSPKDAVKSARASAANAEPNKTERAHAKLIINRGRSLGKEFFLNDNEMHIGRWDADSGIFPDVDLDSDDLEAKVSRRHARIIRRNEQYFIEDLGSTNGTFVNRGRRLLPGDRQQLRDGDEIIIGKTFLRFNILK